MDRATPRLDFAAIGHQDSWKAITKFINGIRVDKISAEKIRQIYSFIPPRDMFRVNVKSKTGKEINGVYIETFIDPDKLDFASLRININKVMKAVSVANKMGAGIVALGGFTSIVLEGNLDSLSNNSSQFTTGNSLTAAFIVKGIEKAASEKNIRLQDACVLVIGSTGDIGMACVHFLKTKVKMILLNARNNQRLEKLSRDLQQEGISVDASISLPDLVPKADIIICAASSSGIKLNGCKNDVIICDAGYPKNLETTIAIGNGQKLFHGGMGQVNNGYSFDPDYSKTIYSYAAPNIIHGCILEAMVLAFEETFESYSAGKGNITPERMEAIYQLSEKHGIHLAPFYNENGLWQNNNLLTNAIG